jgi:hypothetical protein
MVQINSFVVQKCCEEVFVSFRDKRFRVLGWAAAGESVYPVILLNGRPACMARFQPEEDWSVEEDTQEEEESEVEEKKWDIPRFLGTIRSSAESLLAR